MGISRLFWPQEILDQWIVEEKITLEGERLTLLKDNQSFKVEQAAFFEADVGDGEDVHKLVGRVKALSVLEEMGAEHYMDSVIIEDSAYQVVTGFLGEMASNAGAQKGDGAKSISDALAEQTGDAESDDRELLAKFLIENL